MLEELGPGVVRLSKCEAEDFAGCAKCSKERKTVFGDVAACPVCGTNLKRMCGDRIIPMYECGCGCSFLICIDGIMGMHIPTAVSLLLDDSEDII